MKKTRKEVSESIAAIYREQCVHTDGREDEESQMSLVRTSDGVSSGEMMDVCAWVCIWVPG